jgi:hypothetical protein
MSAFSPFVRVGGRSPRHSHKWDAPHKTLKKIKVIFVGVSFAYTDKNRLYRTSKNERFKCLYGSILTIPIDRLLQTLLKLHLRCEVKLLLRPLCIQTTTRLTIGFIRLPN